MRVALVGSGMRPIPPPGYGGVERTIAEFADALRRSGDEVAIVNSVYPGRTGEYRFARDLSGRRHEFRERVVHAHTPVVANQLGRLRLPFAYTTHSRHWFVREGLSQRFGYRLERRAVARASATVAVSEIVREQILRELRAPPPGPLVTIPLGVDLAHFTSGGRDGDPLVAVGVGAIVPVKRWELAARALAGTSFRLRLVGPQPDPDYARRVRSSGPVELLGELSEEALLEEYRRASVLVHPSRVELFPGVVAQAMSCGRAVIGTPPVAAIVEAGRTGAIVPDGSESEIVEGLRAAVLRFQRDPELAIAWGHAGRVRAEREFDWANVVAAHHRLYAAAGLASAP